MIIIQVSVCPRRLRGASGNYGFHLGGMRQSQEMEGGKFASIMACAALLAGCGLFAGKEEETRKDESAPQAPKLVGRIASIPADKRFVLIQSYGTWKTSQGALLTTRGPEERSANLLVTGESLGQFAAADLQSGTVEIGDAVYSQHTPKPQDTSSPPAGGPELPKNQEMPSNENVQKNN